MTACVCLCVRTMCAALAGQCSVQFRREQRRPRPGQSQYSGNPRVFRSPGPYLMGLSKKKVALSRVFLSHCLPLTLLFPSFSHAPPHPPQLNIPWSHFANEWIPSVYSATLPVSLYVAQDFIENREKSCRAIRHYLMTSDRSLENISLHVSPLFFVLHPCISDFKCTPTILSTVN